MKKAGVSKGASKKKVAVMTHVIESNAAGIDVGSTEMFVAVPVDRDPQPVRRFTTFTKDLVGLTDWLKQCGVTSVAMESTGVFWIPLFQLLEDRGFRVCLVNARHAKNVPGRKTDVADCQWLQYLHSVGLLRASVIIGVSYNSNDSHIIRGIGFIDSLPSSLPNFDLPNEPQPGDARLVRRECLSPCHLGRKHQDPAQS